MENYFDQNRPPKSGNVKKLWDWYIKHFGVFPDSITANHPGREARAGGTPAYHVCGNRSLAPMRNYSIYDLDKVLSKDKVDGYPFPWGSGIEICLD